MRTSARIKNSFIKILFVFLDVSMIKNGAIHPSFTEVLSFASDEVAVIDLSCQRVVELVRAGAHPA